MSHHERELMLRCLDGHAELAPIIFHLFHYRRRAEIFDWLIRSRKTGSELWAWFKGEHRGSPMALAKFILSELERSGDAARPVLAHRDFLV